MTPDEKTVERVAKAMAFSVIQPNDASADAEEYWKHTGDLTKHTWKTAARAAISAMPDTTQARNDALREAAKVSAEDRENIVDEIESIICETHEMDVRDIDYAENIVSWLERHHPAALRAISEKTP